MGTQPQRDIKRSPRNAVMLALGCVLAVTLGLTACSNSSNPPSDTNEVDRAASLIDQRQFSEAIYVLSEHMKNMPGDAHARVLLASAYASRAGIEFSSFTSFAFDLSKWDQIDKLVPVSKTNDTLGKISAVANAAVKIDIVIAAFSALPDPQGNDGVSDLDTAVSVLKDGGKLNGGPSLYRAMLETIVFKYDLNHKFQLDANGACQVVSGKLAKWFTQVGGELTDILDDVGNGLSDPASVARVQDISTQVTHDVGIVAGILALPSQSANLNLPPALQSLYGKCDE